MKVKADHIVRIDCELRVRGGDVIESSEKSGPVQYRHGSGKLLRALESKLEDMGVGDEKSGTIKADETRDELSSELTVPRNEFPADAKLEVGAKFEAKGPTGAPINLEVVKADGDKVVARVIHPLSGKDLEFKVKVLSVRPPPPPVPEPNPSAETLDVDPDPESAR
jgi:FKBP-type peptidyl-prolyl cis-trans isomerase SlyD